MSPAEILPPTLILPLLLLALNTATLTTSTATPNASIFAITPFLNSGSPHSIKGRLSFVRYSTCPIAPFSDISCSYSQSIQPMTAITIEAVPCNDTSVLFTFEYSVPGDRYYLSITHLSNENSTVDTGSLYMGDNVTTVVDDMNPNGDFQMLVHDAEFEIGFNRVGDCC